MTLVPSPRSPSAVAAFTAVPPGLVFSCIHLMLCVEHLCQTLLQTLRTIGEQSRSARPGGLDWTVGRPSTSSKYLVSHPAGAEPSLRFS